jgi:hypothetical protein
MAKSSLRRKIPQLRLALEGCLNDHHRFRLRQAMEHLEFLEGRIFVLEEEIHRRSSGAEPGQARVCRDLRLIRAAA